MEIYRIAFTARKHGIKGRKADYKNATKNTKVLSGTVSLLSDAKVVDFLRKYK